MGSAPPPGGYFFVPLIPQDEPFVAVAYDTTSGQTRSFRGIEPRTGASRYMFFDFLAAEQPIETVRWDGGGDGASWDDPFNWDSDFVPTPDQRVIIDVPGNVAVTHSRNTTVIRSLHSAEALVLSGGTLQILETSVLSSTFTQSGGTLDGTGTLTVSGLLTWSGGIQQGSGTTRASGSLLISGAASKSLITRRLENAGSATGNGGSLYGSSRAALLNQAGASLTVSHDGYFFGSGGAASFTNAGTLIRSTSSGTVRIDATFNNTGAVQVQAGTLWLNGGGSSSGTMTINSGTTMQVRGAFTHQASGVINGGGTLDIRTATFTNNGTIAPTVIVLS
jgi:hypothetical protein